MRYDREMSHRYVIAAIFALLLFALTLFLMGQPLICECGYVKWWHGDIFSAENSQQISDWYTFSHVIHGFAFYFIFWFLGKRVTRGRGWPLGVLFLLSLAAEIGWEIFENTDMVINYYRENTISLGYYGDSVINSVCDVLFMVGGFFIARRAPVWLVVATAVGMEAVVAYYIRDNLALNILMFIYPFKTILNWQMGG
jgi:hypothetical protein